jgi:hypothetical protein
MTGDALVSMESVARALRTLGLFILNLLGAIIVPAILEGSVWKLLPVHSVSAVVIKEWCLDLPVAAFMGFMMYRIWRSWTSKWVWVVPALWFGFRALPYAARASSHSVLANNPGFWFHFSGAACAVQASECRDFFAFTVPFVRSLSYSVAALVASRTLGPSPHSDGVTDSASVNLESQHDA